MNKVILMGRLVRDLELRYTTGKEKMAVARFTLAVRRAFVRKGEDDVDFIKCVSFGKSAEFTAKYFGKGQQMAVIGRIKNGSYTGKDGTKKYTTDIIVEEQHFADSKKTNTQQTDNDGFVTVDDGNDDDIPS